MTMNERKAESIRKEIEKLEKRLAREQASAEKKAAIAESRNATCTEKEWFGGMRESYTAEQRDAWFDAYWAMDQVQETKEAIEKAQKRLEKVTGQITERQEIEEEARKEKAHIDEIEKSFINASMRSNEDDYQKWFAEFKAECLKDGIVIEIAKANFFSGFTKSGKRFILDGNNGITERSWHCYCLTVGGSTVFTSGDFFTAYRYIKR